MLLNNLPTPTSNIEHPSTNLIKQSLINKANVEISSLVNIEIKNAITDFYIKYGKPNQASKLYTTKELKDFVIRLNLKNLNEMCKIITHKLCKETGYVRIYSFFPDFNDSDAEIALFIFSCYVGLPMYNNRDKVYIWSIIPEQIETTKALENNFRPGNSGSPIGFHTDTTTFAGLFCLKAAENGGENEIVSAVEVHNRIYAERKDLLEILYSNFYVDRRGEEMDGEMPYCELPIFSKTTCGNLMTHWTSLYTTEAYRKYDLPPMTSTQKEALDYLIATIKIVAAEQQIVTSSSRGDFLIVNNNLVFHNRKSFYGDRHILRIWVYSDSYESIPHLFGYPYD